MTAGGPLRLLAPLGNSSTVEHQNSRLVPIKSRVGFTINLKSCHAKPKESAAIVKLCAVNFLRRTRHARRACKSRHPSCDQGLSHRVASQWRSLKIQSGNNGPLTNGL